MTKFFTVERLSLKTIMQVMRQTVALFFVYVSFALVYGQEIPVIDLTHNQNNASQESTASAEVVPIVPSRQIESFQKPAELLDQKPEGARRLRIFLRELSILQQAAQSIGGDIRVTITPVGITAEDLVVPLTQMGCFDIRPQGDMIIVESKKDDGQVAQINHEIAQLERRRRFLLNDIQILERLAAQKQQQQHSAPAQDPTAVAWQAGPVVNPPPVRPTQPHFSVSVIPASEANNSTQIVEKRASSHPSNLGAIPIRGKSVVVNSKGDISPPNERREAEDNSVINTIVQPRVNDVQVVYPHADSNAASEQPREVPPTPIDLTTIQTSQISP